jgi:hypothetical protein
MNNNETKIINGSYEFTQIYLLYQLLNQLNLGNNHNENISSILNEIKNKIIPTDLSGITSLLNQINNKNNNDIIQAIGNIPQTDLSNIILLLNEIKNKEIPQTDLTNILAALYNIDNTLKYNLPTDLSQINILLNQILNKEIPTTDLSELINTIKSIQIPSYNDSNVVKAINDINIPQVDLTDVIKAINGLKNDLNKPDDINIDINQINICKSKPIIEVEYEQIPNRNISIRKYSTNVVQPPKVIKIVNKEAHMRICGTSSPSGEYSKCIQCVDKWLSANPNPHLSQVTRKGTGCRVK